MEALPTLRRKIRRSFFVLVIIYGLLGLLLVFSVLLASGTTPKVLHIDYDSIAASQRMHQSWSALQFPQFYPGKAAPEWGRQFDDALALAEANSNSPDESLVVQGIRADWTAAKPSLGHLDPSRFQSMEKRLRDLVKVNEDEMFGLAQNNEHLGHRVLAGSLVFFLITLILSIFIADGISQRLSSPLKQIAETLHRRPSLEKKLKLPPPTSLELLILNTELTRLWERLSATEKVNVAELFQQKNKLEGVLESVDDALIVVDPDGKVSHCNECVEKLVGLSKKEIQQQLWRDLATMNENYLKLRSVLKSDMQDAQEVELQLDGKTSQFSARYRALGGFGGHEQGSLFLLHDITEKRRREKFRAEFIDLLSHELKTPIQSLGTATEILVSRKDQVPAELKLMVETISDDVERIRAVVQEFVQVTQSTSKIMKLKLERVDINRLLPEWIKPFFVLSKDRQIKLEIVHEGSENIWANLDLVKFPWVISNLVSNAIRFSPQRSTVLVMVTDRNGWVEIRVMDEGPGVSEAEIGRLFEPAFQKTQITSAGVTGLFGVGLTIAKEVVEAQDGTIEYYRRSPTGSEFRILLPFPS